MSWTAKTTVACLVAAAVIAAAIVIKIHFFSVNDRYFQLNPTLLRRAPAGFVVVRTTHFAGPGQRASRQTGIVDAGVNGGRWIVGRNVSLSLLMAVAYSQNPARIELPPNAPTNNFDFLVTVNKNSESSLQSAIRRKLGYVANRETRDTKVLALKVENPGLPGLTVSADGRENVSPKGGRLYFTHMRLSSITDGLGSVLQTPVVDQTSLTNYYDFSVAWDAQTQRELQGGARARDLIEKILAGWGLGLEPDTASLEMLVVRRI